MSLNVVSVAYPLAPVHSDCPGGAEQVLFQLDRALIDAGHRSTTIAMNGSTLAGRLIPVFCAARRFDSNSLQRAEREVRRRLEHVARSCAPDVFHVHAVNFPALLPATDVPILVTLHLPRSYYRESDLRLQRSHLWMNCVSRAQHATFADVTSLVAPIENCVELIADAPFRGPRNYALWLGRICPEKGTHLAIEACMRAAVPLIIAGKTFPYADHLRYFQEQVAPRLLGHCLFVGPVGGTRKRRLLHEARCVIITTTVPETSSLVAREALAAGTPVVALRSPALEDLIEHGRTGLLVDVPEYLPAAIAAAAELNGQDCLDAARRKCARDRMISEYFALYARLAACRQPRSS